jgi:hypothetical protein
MGDIWYQRKSLQERGRRWEMRGVKGSGGGKCWKCGLRLWVALCRLTITEGTLALGERPSECVSLLEKLVGK